jgi:uncharacterized SAM-binding protein YcdF (DUF218 family)
MYFLVTKYLLQPLPVLLFVIGATIARLWLKRGSGGGRGALAVLTVAFLALTLTAVPAVTYPLFGSLEWSYPPLRYRPDRVDAIVVLAGGIWPADSIRRRPVLGEDSLFRCLYAAELYRQGPPCAVIVTGGVLDETSDIPPVAPAMREALVRLGVSASDVITEPTARTTYESAVEAREIMRGRGFRKAAVVTDAVHMLRSILCFRKVGVDAVPAACSHRATEFKPQVDSFVPSPSAMKDFVAVVHEWVGLLWYRARGRA